MKNLISYIAENETEKLSHCSIEDYDKFFKNSFKIDLSGIKNWDKIIEANYRRNLIVHNSSKTNAKYCEKTSFVKIGVRLSTNLEYVVTI